MRCVPMKRLNSLGVKILLAYLAGTVVSIALLVLAASAMLQGNVLARGDVLGSLLDGTPQRNPLAQMDLTDLAQDMAGRLRFGADGRPAGFEADEDELEWVFNNLQHEAAYRVLDEDGAVVLLSRAGTAFWPAAGDAARLKGGHFAFEREDSVFYGATAPTTHDGRSWYVQVAASSRLMTLLHRVALPLVGTGVVVFSLVLLIAFGLCAYFTLRYTLKPLREVSESAAAISPRSMHARLKTEAVPAEIAPLVDSFNRALARLEHGYRLQQEFLGTAAHELKTPLALIRAQIELKEDDGPERQALLSDVEYMTRQVQQLLLLAEASETQNYHFATVTVESIAREAANYLQRMADTACVRLEISADTREVKWNADRGALFTLLKNLLENAIQHAPAGTTVSIAIQPDSLSVRDHGPGADAAQLPLLFERFWRAPHRRDLGAGLGLAICREIAMAHGWRLGAERAEPGLRFLLQLGDDEAPR